MSDHDNSSPRPESVDSTGPHNQSGDETRRPETGESDPSSRSASGDLRLLALAVIAIIGIGAAYWFVRTEPKREAGESTRNAAAADPRQTRRDQLSRQPRFLDYGNVVFWWDALPEKLQEVSLQDESLPSNMHRDDYVGPESCEKCHKVQHQHWLQHSHRRMNAEADEQNVMGDFGDATLEYLGGVATFLRVPATESDDGYRMRLEREGVTIVYACRQTIGSRFFQYYVGQMIEGPFAEDHPYRQINHVLPFGYWLEQKQWVPVVHVGPENPDGERDDPFAPPQTAGESFLPYASTCSMCHTTFSLADDLTRKPNIVSRHAPMRMHWHMSRYFREQRPELWGDIEHPADVSDEGIHAMPEAVMTFEANEHAVTLGISCEACHLGAKAHAKDPKVKPDFHPHSPYLRVQTANGKLNTGRLQQNVNWACGRCHVGGRPMYAGGMSTWNSVEFSDAMLGSCYSQLRCVDCHNPHQGIGAQWTATPARDDASCIRCHSKFETDAAIQEHTHHGPGEGSRCMNCHMPRINEGLQDLVRTHTIFSPTHKEMIEENHPNACNLCHVEQSIDWTLQHLKEWYGAEYDSQRIAANYGSRQKAVGLGWLQGDYEPVRLVAADAIFRTRNRELLPFALEALNDPYLINRQFAQRSLERLLSVKLSDYGYRFYMSRKERAEPMERIRQELPAIFAGVAGAPNAGTAEGTLLPPLETPAEGR